MKGKISDNGLLSIKRKNVYVEMYCPYTDEARCGHWCPLFGEPMEFVNIIKLKICSTEIIFDELEDQRR